MAMLRRIIHIHYCCSVMVTERREAVPQLNRDVDRHFGIIVCTGDRDDLADAIETVLT
jgi:hypothetical protein